MDSHSSVLSSMTGERRESGGDAAVQRNHVKYPIVNIIMLASCSMLMYAMRFNTTIALNGKSGLAAKEMWTNEQKSQVLGGFFWGYIILQIPGGVIASRYGGKQVMTVCMAGSVIFTALGPVVAREDELPLVVVRAFCGLAQSSMYPAWAAIVADHLPKRYHNFAAASFSGGSSLGVMLMWLVGPPIQQHLGWEFVFYAPAIGGAAWLLLWLLCGPRHIKPLAAAIYEDEAANHLINNTDDDTEIIPQKTNTGFGWIIAMFTEKVMIAIYCASFASAFVFYNLLSFLPQYMHQRYGLDLDHAADVSVIPYGVRFASLIVLGPVTDMILKSGKVSTIIIRKTMTGLALFVPAIVLLIMATTIVTEDTAVVLLTIGVAISGFNNVGAQYAPIEIFPNTAGGAYGFSNCFGNIAGIIAPAISGALLDAGHCPKDGSNPINNSNVSPEVSQVCQHAWDKVFLVGAGISIFGTIAYCGFGGLHDVYRNEKKNQKRR